MEAFETYIESLKKEMLGLTDDLGQYKSLAEEKAASFVDDCKEDFKKWTTAFARGELSRKDFEWLVNSKKDLLKLDGLKSAGLAEIQAKNFGNKLLSLTINKALEFAKNREA